QLGASRAVHRCNSEGTEVEFIVGPYSMLVGLPIYKSMRGRRGCRASAAYDEIQATADDTQEVELGIQCGDVDSEHEAGWGVVLEVAADGGVVNHDIDAEGAQVGGGADARELEQLG